MGEGGKRLGMGVECKGGVMVKMVEGCYEDVSGGDVGELEEVLEVGED